MANFLIIEKSIDMLTIKAEIRKSELKTDNTYNVKIRFTLDRKTKRLSTSLFVSPSELTKKGGIKDKAVCKREIDKLILFYKEKCDAMQVDINHYSLEEVMSKLQRKEKEEQRIDFIQFAKEWIENTTIKGKKNYISALNSFLSFLGTDTLDIKKLNTKVLRSYIQYLDNQRAIKEKALITKNKRIPSNRAVSLYLGSLRHLYKEAQLKYNDYDEDLILIPHSPFDRISVPKQEVTRKRALTVEQIRNIYLLRYKNTEKGYRKTCRFDLAKDCFILSFCLIGMNSVDLYNATELNDNKLIYYRTKTKARRMDKARMEVNIPKFLMAIINKYKDPTGRRVFSFYQYYSTETAFNRALNIGLKEIGEILDIEDLEFYAARHSWATVALNKAGIDKYTVHSALNHVDESMRVTDIYIQRDFIIENNANSKVMQYVFGDILTDKLESLTHDISHSFFVYGMRKFA